MLPPHLQDIVIFIILPLLYLTNLFPDSCIYRRQAAGYTACIILYHTATHIVDGQQETYELPSYT